MHRDQKPRLAVLPGGVSIYQLMAHNNLMDIRRRNEITIGVLMAFAVNMMLGAVIFGVAIFVKIWDLPDNFNPRWPMAFPFAMLFITGIITGLAIMLSRAGKIVGAVIGLVCGILVTSFFVFLMPEWTLEEGSGIGSGINGPLFSWFFLAASLGIINMIGGSVAAIKNSKR